MLIDFSNIRIFLRPGYTDMRKQINSLAIMASKELNDNIFNGNLFLFCSRSKKHLKILYWDRNGFCLWWKRLEKGTFPWPSNKDEVRELTSDELFMLLQGIDFFKAHQTLDFKSVS